MSRSATVIAAKVTGAATVVAALIAGVVALWLGLHHGQGTTPAKAPLKGQASGGSQQLNGGGSQQQLNAGSPQQQLNAGSPHANASVGPLTITPPAPPPTAAPTPPVCDADQQAVPENVPSSTFDPIVHFNIVVHCTPPPGNTYWWFTRFNYAGHSEWHVQGTVTQPGINPIEYSPSVGSSGSPRDIAVYDCTSDASRQLQSYTPHDAILEAGFPSGCHLASQPVQMTWMSH
ncbi:MAG: hypothetical protein QOH66_1822 [Actinomycetota bacterium]|nr:hypothetical protein [Actinomycetota bacterium]